MMKLSLKKSVTLLIVGLFIVGGAIATWLHRCPRDYLFFADVGAHSSRDAAIRASIKRLSVEIRRCPRTTEYRISWQVRSNGIVVAQSFTLYDRRGKAIGYEDDPLSGFTKFWGDVDDATIHVVAERNGNLDDFARISETKIRPL